MKYKELIKIVKSLGWQLKSTGNHFQYIHPIKKNVLIIPFHGAKEVPTGTARRILKDAGLEKNRKSK